MFSKSNQKKEKTQIKKIRGKKEYIMKEIQKITTE
jgi:hypothetical protein